VLQQIEGLLVERRKQGTADNRVEMAAMFHERKNMIAPARWNVESLASSETTRDHAERDIIEDVHGSLVSAIELVAKFLLLMREDALHMANEGFWLHEMPPAFGDLSVRDTRLAGHAVRLEGLPSVRIKGPSTYLLLALRNLASNAFEADATHVRVHGVVSHHAAGVTLTVADNGPGLPSKVLEHLFEPFNSHGKDDGTGLGIYLSKARPDAGHSARAPAAGAFRRSTRACGP
jgi:signal transduction histidine kinase